MEKLQNIHILVTKLNFFLLLEVLIVKIVKWNIEISISYKNLNENCSSMPQNDHICENGLE